MFFLWTEAIQNIANNFAVNSSENEIIRSVFLFRIMFALIWLFFPFVFWKWIINNIDVYSPESIGMCHDPANTHTKLRSSFDWVFFLIKTTWNTKYQVCIFITEPLFIDDGRLNIFRSLIHEEKLFSSQ